MNVDLDLIERKTGKMALKHKHHPDHAELSEEPHDHHKDHSHGLGGHHHFGQLDFAVALTAMFIVIETSVGLYIHSLALLSDAGHNVADIIALLLAWYALRVERRPANANRTFGYHRVGIVTALVNAGSLIFVAGFIIVEAIHRFFNPEPVVGIPMALVAILSFLINGFIALRLYRQSKSDLNISSAFIHMAGDAAAAIGIIIAAIFIIFTGISQADPAISVIIAMFILASSWQIVREAVNILLEASPKNLNMPGMITDLTSIPGVRAVHDLHVWSISTNRIALSCHIELSDTQHNQKVVETISKLLSQKYQINHVTLQTECNSCLEDETGTVELFCQISPYCVEHQMSHYH